MYTVVNLLQRTAINPALPSYSYWKTESKLTNVLSKGNKLLIDLCTFWNNIWYKNIIQLLWCVLSICQHHSNESLNYVFPENPNSVWTLCDRILCNNRSTQCAKPTSNFSSKILIRICKWTNLFENYSRRTNRNYSFNNRHIDAHLKE